MLITRLVGHTPALAFNDALRALSSLDWSGSRGRPGVIAYLPVFRGNPYQSLLYSQLSSTGLRALPMYDAEQAAAFVDASAGTDLDVVVHLHWLNVVTAKAHDESEAQEAVKGFLEHVYGLKERGARLLWTVHNVLPHDTQFPDVDAELRSSIAQLADRVHVMSPLTRELVAPWFDIPEEKLLLVPHPGYQDVYPSWISKEQARVELGIPQGAIVFLLVGAVKPYKGLTELLDAFDELAGREPGRFVLLVAGRPDRQEETQQFCERLLIHPAALGALRQIPHDEMQVYLRAADVAVFPYRRSLNSGALALALTFGLPVVLPDHSGEAATADSDYAQVYEPSDPNGLLEALAACVRLVSPEARTAAAAAGERVHVRTVARRFAEQLRTWLDDEAAAPPRAPAIGIR